APDRAGASDVSRGADWLASAQNVDGGFGSAPDDESGPDLTAWAMLGLAAAGRNPLDVSRAGRTPVDFLRGAVEQLKSPGDLARTILALESAGVEPRDFAGANLVSRLLAKRRQNGSYEGWPNSTAFAVMALRTAGASRQALEPSLSWLNEVQNDDGGWGDVPGLPSTADGTSAVMQALSPGSKAAQRGLSYLRQTQRPGGGFPLAANGSVNTQSTAWAIQAILALGGDPDSFRRGGKSAPDYLAAQQQGDGHYRYSKDSDQTPVWVTAYGIMAAAADPFPISAPARAPKPAPSSADTGGLIPDLPTAPAASIPPATGSPSAPEASPVPSTPPSPGSGSPPKATPVPGGVGSGGAPLLIPPSEGDPDEVAPATAPVTPEPVSEDDSTSPYGAIMLGLLAGGLLFGAARGTRKLWLRQRYGL
ncbi:MAG: prenyltransferase/squalene oxidase repeat-containing protein, partial [Solirubrobacterales bacterium]